ncbi:MAG: RsmD family RNA methyltransferase [Bacteroidales bacterium]|nr:RsmD family RNA methyltransferase [Bacteroidales bacterium]
MRIVSGAFKGRRINPPSNLQVRPTTDMAKESLFNILANNVTFEDIDVLDLFAGTGSISYEFVSRGCRSVTAIDNNSRCIDFIKKMAGDLKMEILHAYRDNVFRFLKHNKKSYNLIFADPPYDLPGLVDIPDLVLNSLSLAKDGWFILEHPRRIMFSDHKYLIQHRQYGHVNFTFFQLK